MNRRLLLLSILATFLLPQSLWAQAGVCNAGGCATGVLFGAVQTTTSNTFVPSVAATFAGEYNEYNVINGQQYEWSLCPGDGATNPTGDAQLTLKNAAGTNLCYADDVCGVSPKILWSANFTGVARVQINQFNCLTNTNSHTVVWRCVSCAAALPGETQALAINAGALGCGSNYSDTKNNTAYLNDYNGQPSGDIYYTFTLTSTQTVNISHCNSGFDTYMYLLNNAGAMLASNDNNGPICATSRASIQTTLAAGTYYVVSEGAGSNVGSITTEISVVGPSPTVTGNISICAGASTTLTANVAGATAYSWYLTPTGGTPISTNASLTVTPATTTTYYVEAASGTAAGPQTLIPIPGHQTTFSNSIRGFYFTAPVAFTISGLEVPTNASAGPSSIAVVRFNGNIPPPAFPGTTNAFAQLYLTQNNATAGIIPVNIPVAAGEVIGVYGARNDINSYGGTTPIATTIGGQPATLQRTGMQFPLSSSAGGMHDIWFEANYYISRTNVYYSTGTGLCLSSRVPVTVTVNPSPTASATTTPTCSTNGTITVTGSNGTAPYQYSLNNGTYQAGNVFTNIAGGTYPISVQDANGCTGTSTATVTVATAPSISTSSTNASCANTTNGTITITGSSGTPAYQYNLNGGTYQVGNGFTNLPPATYTAGIQDANGCTASTTVTISSPPAINVTNTPIAVSCNGGNDGSILVNANGGTPGFQYSINGGAYGTGNSFPNLTANNYTISVLDANNCTVSSVVAVTEPTLLTASVTASTNVTCNNVCDGTAVANASGGTPSYNYSWSNGQTTANASGLCAGTHTCYVTDANGCTTTTTVTIAQPSTLSASASIGSAILCNGGTGSILVSAVGGVPPYTGTGTFNVIAGTYVYNVSDANGCAASTTITITEPTPVLASVLVTTPIACNGGNAVVTVSASGGTPAYTGTGNYTVAAGTYTYTVTDANGCASNVASITVTEPTALVASSTSTPIACNGGNSTVTVTASGGTPAYTGTGTFSVVAGPYNFTVTDANGCTATTSGSVTAPSSLSITLNSTPILCNGGTSVVTVGALGGSPGYTGAGSFTVNAGTHTYTVADTNGCTATGSISITEPTLLVASASSTPILCNGGTSVITVSGSGGTPNYTGTGSFSGLTVGTYNYTITDANACTASTSITITEPTLLVANAMANPILCNGGTTTVAVSGTGGTPAYTGTGNFVVNAGTYSYPITDANGCAATATITLTEPTLLTAAITASTNISCNGVCDGSATVSAAGGTPNYSYSWSNGQMTATLTGACAGTYTCYV
ncbi:MAG: beta strand repeat-containing protein, partial [Bacteroidia bacterium]